jgi:hypothetical protein
VGICEKTRLSGGSFGPMSILEVLASVAPEKGAEGKIERKIEK